MKRIKNRDRPPAVAGLFYPDSCYAIENFLRKQPETPLLNVAKIPKALVVPHAGYVYSGACAAKAYRLASIFQNRYKRVAVVGPSHRISFDGISGGYYQTLPSPCGNIVVDTPYLITLAKRFPVGFVPEAHRKEHATEVQFPMIKYYLPRCKAIELIYANFPLRKLAEIFTAVLHSDETLLIVSTDLSHYHPRETARKKDFHCLKAFNEKSLEPLRAGCEACGLKGLAALILAAKKLRLTPQTLCYTDSGERDGRNDRVVGYMSGVLFSQ